MCLSLTLSQKYEREGKMDCLKVLYVIFICNSFISNQPDSFWIYISLEAAKNNNSLGAKMLR